MTAAALAAAVTWTALVDPHRRRSWHPRCPTKAVTGLDCPGCGGMRLAHDVIHRRWGEAVHDNPYLLGLIPAGAGLALADVARRRRGRPGIDRDRAALWIGASAAAWMALRNLPGWRLRPTSL